MNRSEPSWLTALRDALAVGTQTDVFLVEVRLADLREAIGAAAPGPGSEALVGWGAVDGHLTIDYQTLLRWVHLTPAQAKQFAETILRQLHEAPAADAHRRLSSATQN